MERIRPDIMLSPVVKTLPIGAPGRILRRVIPLFSIVVGLTSSILYGGNLVPIYGTYFGGTGDTNAAVAAAVALDTSGNVIVAGVTSSQTLPGTANAFQPTKAVGFPDNQNVYIAKFNPTGQVLLWASFLGGDEQDRPTSVAVDPGGNVKETAPLHDVDLGLMLEADAAAIMRRSQYGLSGFSKAVARDQVRSPQRHPGVPSS
ncbi:MAG: hypothetical protein ABSG13_20915 [Bryobacteraceae bacterium]|jgi:hypothetical protein